MIIWVWGLNSETCLFSSLIDKNDIPIPDLMKIDVQRFELEVLKGGESCFGYTEVFILEVSLFQFLENQPLLHEVINFMLDRNYVLYDFLNMAHRPLDRALGQIDACFVRRDGLLRDSDRWV